MLRKTWLLVDEVGSVTCSLCHWDLDVSDTVLFTDLLLKFVFNSLDHLRMRGD